MMWLYIGAAFVAGLIIGAGAIVVLMWIAASEEERREPQ